MSSDEKVLDFPRVEVTPEESARRVMVEATRLASLAPGEWRLWIDRSAERLRIPRATLQDLIVAIIKNCEKMARDAETAARRQGTVTGQRNSRTRLRVSCHPSRTSEHSSVGAAKRRDSVRMFG